MSIANPWLDYVKGRPPVMNATPQDYPAISVKEERKCLHEIRNMGKTMPVNHRLWNGVKATDFALQFILSHHLKRKTKSALDPLPKPVTEPQSKNGGERTSSAQSAHPATGVVECHHETAKSD
jgi:hypothetical protein